MYSAAHNVQQGPGRQPWRDRGPRVPRGVRVGNRSAALYTPEDRDSVHRVKADEGYEIGEAGHPVSAYLDVELDRRAGPARRRRRHLPGLRLHVGEPGAGARRARARASFSSGRRRRCWRRRATRSAPARQRGAAGVPVLKASDAAHECRRGSGGIGGNGVPAVRQGRGGRRRARACGSWPPPGSWSRRAGAAMREAEGAFGDGTVYLEQAMIRARHIEVQILADAAGEVVHLFERDCSVQRRHQKVIELAPAPNLDPRSARPDLRGGGPLRARDRLRERGYRRVPRRSRASGGFAFIEMNPRIQVEHTVTEETTEVDLVRAQILIAGGATLAELGLRQDRIRQRGFALQCRVTTEDPAADFRPDAGRISAYRAPGGAGIRLDEGSAYRRRRDLAVLRPAAAQGHGAGRELPHRHHAGPPGSGGGPRARRQHQSGVSAGGAATIPTSAPDARTRRSSTSTPS